jgi:subtilisin family serine protease
MADQETAERSGRYSLKKIKEVWDLDPHLQEQILARAAGQRPYPLISSKQGEVDVIAKLKDAGKPVPELFHLIRRIGEDGTTITGTVAADDIETVRGHDSIASLKAGTELYLNLHNSVPAIHCNPEALDEAARLGGKAYPGVKGSRVIVGIVDFGCDFRHANFRGSTGATRLLYLWDQSDAPDRTLAPQGFGYGRELDGARINAALGTADPYQTLGYAPPPSAHGTHVTDIAAGGGLEPALVGGKPGIAPVRQSHAGVAPDASIIFVHLKNENGSLGNSRHLLEAVDYIFSKAEDLGMPAVVNLSLSTSGGPHDGSTPIEQGFEDLLKEPGRAIVVSVGNAYVKEGHVNGTVKKGGMQEIQWYTDPRAPKNEAEVWYSGSEKLMVTLVSPEGDELGPVSPGETQDIYSGGLRVGRISHRRRDPNNGDNQIDIRVPALEGIAQPWKIRLRSETNDLPFDAWIEQDDSGTARFGSPTETAGTLGSICCGPSPLAVGAYDTSENAYQAPPYAATAAGPTRKGANTNKPDISAPGVNVVAARSQGGVTIMSGTSMAAAHVTGLVALLFDLAQRAGRGFLPIDITRKIVLAAAMRSPQLGQWDPRLGFGRIDGPETLQELLNTTTLSQPSAPGPSDSILRSPAPEGLVIVPGNGKNGGSPQTHLEALVAELHTTSFKLTVSEPN